MKRKKALPFAPIGGHKKTGICPLCGRVAVGGLQVVAFDNCGGIVCSDCADRLRDEWNNGLDDFNDEA